MPLITSNIRIVSLIYRFDLSIKKLAINLKITIMKKILFAALITVSVASSAFTKDEKKAASAKEEKATAVANDKNKISYKTLAAFAAEFDGATDVNWSSKPNFDRATFNLDGKQLSAFFTFSGEKIGTTEELSFEALPSRAKQGIAKKYNSYSIKETILFETDRESAYFVAAESNDQSVILKFMNGHVTVFKKQSKAGNSNSFDKSLQAAIF